MNNKLKLVVAGIISLIAGSVMAGSIKQWTNGQTLTAGDLNNNFAHIHSLMVGGHGPRLVDADVSASAAISSTKLADGNGIASGWGHTYGACNGASSASCTMDSQWGITDMTGNGATAGIYLITTSQTLNANAMVCIGQHNTTNAGDSCTCDYTGAHTITLACTRAGVATNMEVKFVFWSH